MRKYLLIGVMLIGCCLRAVADDTIVTVHQHADTLRLQDTRQTVDLPMDSLLVDEFALLDDSTLLALVEEQSRRLADSLYRDSLRIDSIRIEAQHMIEEIGLQTEVHDIRIEKHIFRDEEQDRQDIIRAIKQQYSPWYKEARTLVQFTQNYRLVA